MIRKTLNRFNTQSGFSLLLVILVGTIMIASFGGLATLQIYQQKLYKQQAAKEQALYVAEAGINYYVWHLAHNQTDYFDGTGSDPTPPDPPYGPYQHSYVAPSSGIQGYFELEITPPPIGSTIVTIKSTGWLDEYPNLKRDITVQYGIPSLATYSLLTNTDVWLGSEEKTVGHFHSNGGIRMDGPNDSLVTSARSTYTCGSSHGCTSSNCASPCVWSSGCQCPGIWGAGPNSDLWSYPYPIVDFNEITFDVSQMKTDAQSDGFYLGSSGGGNDGYHVIFQIDGTFDIYEINDLGSQFWQGNDDWTGYTKISEDIDSETFLSNNSIPNNGIIFLEDDVWVEGTLNGRATLVAARLPDVPSQRKTINIVGNINYMARDGNHALGLIAQKHIKVLRLAPSDLTIDAILLAQNGHVFRNIYRDNTDRIVDNNIEIYGGVISNMERNFTWVSSGTVIDGYASTTSIFDPQVTFSPPPSFPTTGEYTFISWEEN